MVGIRTPWAVTVRIGCVALNLAAPRPVLPRQIYLRELSIGSKWHEWVNPMFAWRPRRVDCRIPQRGGSTSKFFW